MSKTFKISTKYWNSLSEKEQMFFKYNVGNAGIPKCKRIITLANIVFPEWDDIIDFHHYSNLSFVACNWLVMANNNPVGIIHKSDGYGITESIEIKTNRGYLPAWDNSTSKNPPKDLRTERYWTEYYSEKDMSWDNGLDFFSLNHAVKYAKAMINDGWDKVVVYRKRAKKYTIEKAASVLPGNQVLETYH